MDLKKPIGQIKDTSLESELTVSPQGSNSYEDKGNEASVISTSGQEHSTHDVQHGKANHEAHSAPSSLGDDNTSLSSEGWEELINSNALQDASARFAEQQRKYNDAVLEAAANLTDMQRKRSEALQAAGASLVDLQRKHKEALLEAGASLTDIQCKRNDALEAAGASLPELTLNNSDNLRSIIKHWNNLKYKNEVNKATARIAALGLSDEYWKLISNIELKTSIYSRNMDFINKSSYLLKDANILESTKNAIKSFNVLPAGSLFRHLKHLSLNNDIDALASDWSNTGKDLKDTIKIIEITKSDKGDE
ncbi:hypothetical protein GOY18_13080 [Aeromonas hydrophila]|uniref:hypothetical protein n=1 Tax=Aeromonas hydrophila TaxID=644 RepID=UPI001C5A89F8|nr:hypothetical protein [Aeromonas hydrophila]MBW3809253.1 hypothetical protein [Aeromonas hydrophila]UCM59218.1 hypothetical protein LEO74_08745 [Aeromonas hydrophila]